MMAQNTLELARQGDPSAIAMILTYYLSQRLNATASAIRLGDYLSVLIDASFALDQDVVIALILGILRDLRIPDLGTVEISAREMSDREVLWSQTIEFGNPPTLNIHMTDSTLDNTIEQNSEEPSENRSTSLSPSDAPTVSAIATHGSAPPATAPEPDNELSLQTLLQRPEMVALLAFAIMLVLWDSYVEWMQEGDRDRPLSRSQLARRLGVSGKTLNRVKDQANFQRWSQALDPDGIAWHYANRQFIPHAPTAALTSIEPDVTPRLSSKS